MLHESVHSVVGKTCIFLHFMKAKLYFFSVFKQPWLCNCFCAAKTFKPFGNGCHSKYAFAPKDSFWTDIFILYVDLIYTIRCVGTSCACRCLRLSENIAHLVLMPACIGLCTCWYSRLISFLVIFSPQRKGPSYRCGVPVPSGGHLPWTLSRVRTSQASGPGTPMDPTPPVWKTKLHRYVSFWGNPTVFSPWKGVFWISFTNIKLYNECYSS